MFDNVKPMPAICNTYSSCAVRYDDSPTGSCSQLGPDLNAGGRTTSPTTRTPTGLDMKLAYGSNSLTVHLVCDKGAGKGRPGHATPPAVGLAYEVDWYTAAVCRPDPGRAPLHAAAAAATTRQALQDGQLDHLRI